MLYKTKSLIGYKLHALDGTIGEVAEFYFDDHYWTIRYLVAFPKGLVSTEQVLISPYALLTVNKDEKSVAISLTIQQIQDSPAASSDKPVSRQIEEAYYEYYGWPKYWSGSNTWGFYPTIMHDTDQREVDEPTNRKAWDHNLRSTSVVSSFAIHANDGEIGHVDDFIIDDHAWTIRYIVADTGIRWGNRKVLISPTWIEHVSWDESKVYVNVSRETIRKSPAYSDAVLLTRDYESGLHEHYNRLVYWDQEGADGLVKSAELPSHK